MLATHELRNARQRLAVQLAWHPEWWVTGTVAVDWLVLLARHPLTAPAGAGHHGAASTGISEWALMAVAMMVPMALPAVRHVAHNSIRRRRQGAMVLYLLAYVAVWVGFGAVVLGALWLTGAGQSWGAVGPARDGRLLIASLLLIAAAWQLSRTKRRAILSCRRTVPLPPQGRRADVACLRMGLWHGRRCWSWRRWEPPA